MRIEVNAIIPIGHFCHCSNHFKQNNLKLYSLPFDWIRCDIPAIKHIIENDFKIFMDKNYYIPKVKFWSDIVPCLHTFYSKKFTETRLFNHHNLCDDNDYQYFNRCIERFRIIRNDKLFNKLFVRMEFCDNIKSYEIDDKILDLNNFISKYFSKYYVLIIKLYKDFYHKKDVIREGNVIIIYKSYTSSTDGSFFKDDNDRIELQDSIDSLFTFDLLTIESFK